MNMIPCKWLPRKREGYASNDFRRDPYRWGGLYWVSYGCAIVDFRSALRYLYQYRELLTVNLGTGSGTSVLQIIKSFERVSGQSVPYQIAARRPGDIAECWANPTRAEQKLAWVARRSLDDMCADVWRWQSSHPDGFQ
jgi:UDP-glucose 4-epimerase